MAAAGGALLFSALGQLLSTRPVEPHSEIVCWVTLPALVWVTRRVGTRNDGETSGTSVNGKTPITVALIKACFFALSVAAACWCRAENHIIVLYPAITPLLLVSGVGPIASTTTGSRWPPLPAITSTWVSALIAAFSSFVLVASTGTDIPSLAACVPVVALLYGGYLAISRLSVSPAEEVDFEGGAKPLGVNDVTEGIEPEDVILPLALRILPMLAGIVCVRMFLLHQTDGGPVAWIFVIGLVKALGWFFTFKATRQSSWCIAGTTGTFAALTSASAQNLSWADTSSYLRTSIHLLASLLSLCQTIHLVPKGTKVRSWLWALGVLPIVPLVLPNTVYDIHPSALFHTSDEHPVEILVRAAEADFDAMLQRQSPDYTTAVAEYHRRYRMEPPPGFDAWYSYAVALESPIIDDFDMIHEAIAPFLRMSGQRVREAMAEAGDAHGADLAKCQFRKETGETHCNHPSRPVGHIEEAFGRWLRNVSGVPDLTFLVNPLDEPRVMLPAGEGSKTGDDGIHVENLSKKPTWDTLTRSCSPEPLVATSSRLRRASAKIASHGIPFVTDAHAEKDLCRHPEYRDMHGVVMSPTSFVLLDGAVPVLSTGTLSTMGDVLFPSPAYGTGDDGFAYAEDGDVEWDEKHDNLYWAGSTTGGYAEDDEGWKRFHRQRFVALAEGLVKGEQHWYLTSEHDGSLHRVMSALPNNSSNLFDVFFVDVIQCREDACDSQRRYFDLRPRADKDAALHSKLVFDLDGNGISGRFRKLLASRSAVLKQTLFREWHDERLVAWVHYIPVSQGLKELPELVTWLTGTEEGRKMAEVVGERGRQWALRALRDQDRAIYAYRLMLELARVQAALLTIQSSQFSQ